MLATFPVNHQLDCVFGWKSSDDLFHEETDQPLLGPVIRRGVIPNCREVLSQLKKVARSGGRAGAERLRSSSRLSRAPTLCSAAFQRCSRVSATKRFSGSTASYCRPARAAS